MATTHKEVIRTHSAGNGVDRQTVHATDEQTPEGSVMAARVLRWLLGALTALLAIRFILALLGANRANPFADFIFGLSHPFVSPFFSLFGYEPTYGASRIELGTLVAMAVYALVVYGIISLIRIPRGGSEV